MADAASRLSPTRASQSETDSSPVQPGTPRRDAGIVAEPSRVIGGHVSIDRPLPALILTALSCALMTAAFPALGWWPLAYVCLVPWLMCVCCCRSAKTAYLCSELLGLAFALINVRWAASLSVVGYLLICLYTSLFVPLAAWPIRHLHRRRNVSAALVAPIAWVTIEYLRAATPLSFPFLFLAHTQYSVRTMLQISDLTGAYGVSFVIAMVNGWVADLLIQPIVLWRADRPERAARMPIGSLTTGLVVLGTIIYGALQGSPIHFKPGPRVAVVQGDFACRLNDRDQHTRPQWMLDSYLDLCHAAAAERPDLIVLPESAWRGCLNDKFLEASPQTVAEIGARRAPLTPDGMDLQAWQQFSREARDAFQSLATQLDTPIIVGGVSVEDQLTGIPARVDVYNSAFLSQPGRPDMERYDKMNLVLFGEYVPFRFEYHAVYEWLNGLTPWGRRGLEHTLTPGEDRGVFQIPSPVAERDVLRIAVPICYEEAIPSAVREFVRSPDSPVGGKRADLVASISNDGWFGHSIELEQHLASAVFRAVENRTGMARSVNTGESMLVDSNGGMHHRVSLSPRDLAKLPDVESALHEMAGCAARLLAAADTSNGEFDGQSVEFKQLALVRLGPALDAVGPGLRYFTNRLMALSEACDKPGADRNEATGALVAQLETDAATIRRWRELPWTAPGYAVGELPLDDRQSVYTRIGDRFAQAATGLTLVMLLDWLIRRLRRRQGTEGEARGHQG